MLKTHGTKYSRMDQVKFVEDKKKITWSIREYFALYVNNW